MCRLPERRLFLKCALAVGLTSPFGGALRAADAKGFGPQVDDVFVFLGGERAGQIVTPSDLIVGAPPVLAWPMELAGRVVRDESWLNLVAMMRLDPASLDEATRLRAAEGIVAYSATCTHAQCALTGWDEEKKALSCPCHQSQFDPTQSAKVVSGPAPRALPGLPVRIEKDVLVAAGSFIGRPGARGT